MKKIIIYFIFFTLFLINLPINAEENIDNNGWSNSIIISTESNQRSYRAILDTDQYENVHIAWNDNSNYLNSGLDSDVFYKKKLKDKNFSVTEIISNDNRNCHCLFMYVDFKNIVHILRSDQSNENDIGGIYYTNNSKDIWSEAELISTNSSGDCGCPNMFVDNMGTIHVTWSDSVNFSDSGDDQDIFYKYKKIGEKWSKQEVVSTESSNDSWKPSLIVDQDYNLHFIWEDRSLFKNSGEDYDIYYKMKPYNSDFKDTEIVTKKSTNDSLNPSKLIFDSKGNLHLAWEEKTNYTSSVLDSDIFYIYKTKNGTWSKKEIISIESKSSSTWPSLAVDNNDTVYIVWSDKIFFKGYRGHSNIFYKKKTSNNLWGELELVSKGSSGDSYFTSIDVSDEGIVHVSWYDKKSPDNWIVYYNFKNIDENDPLFEDVDNSVDDKNSDYDKTPGFEFIFLFFTLVLIFILKRYNVFS